MKWAAFFLALLFLGLPELDAHQLAVERVHLVEEGGGRYVLRCNLPAAALRRLGLPILPQRCAWEDVTADGAEAASASDLRFICQGGPLTAEERIVLPWQRNGVLAAATWSDGTSARQFILSGPGGIVIDLGQLQAGSGSWLRAAGRYSVLGVEHILKGLDHVLFLVGLLLLVRGARALALTVTAFTVAHSITLALSVLGAVTVSQGSIEAIVALSIVFLAVENVRALRGIEGLSARRPWLVSFGFGLIHGLGFAGALNALGLPRSEIPPALLFFNVGVELGQLGVVALWLAAAWAARVLALTWPRPARWVPHYALGILATFWFLERSLKLFQS